MKGGNLDFATFDFGNTPKPIPSFLISKKKKVSDMALLRKVEYMFEKKDSFICNSFRKKKNF